jgi:hypothetical protein
MFNKYAGDTIAQEMLKLIKSASHPEHMDADDASDKKVHHAEDHAHDGMMHHMDDSALDSSEELSDDSSDSSDESWDSSDFILSDEPSDAGDDSLEGHMTSMADYMDDDLADDSDDSMGHYSEASERDVYLMKGLGKIEASLRAKGEGFAADLVRVTASEIRTDIVKQAASRKNVVRELVKMASGLIDSGDLKAASLVRDTITKINR